MADEVYLVISSGPAAGRRFALPEGQVLRVGRNAAAEVSVPEDSRLSAFHFSIERRPSGIEICDLDSTLGTQIGGRSVSRAPASDGDSVLAGQSTFAIHSPVEKVGGADSSGGETIRQVIFEQSQPLYALLDAARDRRIKRILERQTAPYESLYQGKQGEELADFAPYIVRVYANSPLVDELIENAWGNSWGVFLRCPLSILEVRRHFRHFLLLKDETGEEFYFRFYDPRVLRVFLPTCTKEQRLEFFGPVVRFLMEDERGTGALEFTISGEVLDHSLAGLVPDGVQAR